MIAVCGEALIDFTPRQLDGELAYKPLPGGSPCNVAVGLARLGKRTAFIGKVSNDRFGDILHAHLTRNAVDLRWLTRGDEPTALAFVIPGPDREGGHDFAFYGNDTAEQSLTEADIPAGLPDDVTTLHFGSYSLMLGESARAYETLMRRESQNRAISLDPNVRPALFPHRTAYRQRIETLLQHTTLVKASAEDLAWLYPTENHTDIAARWLNLGPSLVVVTLGENGATALSHNAAITIPALPIDLADAVGAGDAFTSALLTHLDNQDLLNPAALTTLTADALSHALAYANHAAALTCTRPGANPPTSTELTAGILKQGQGL